MPPSDAVTIRPATRADAPALGESPSRLADPADLSRRHSRDEGEIGHVLCDHRTGGDDASERYLGVLLDGLQNRAGSR